MTTNDLLTTADVAKLLGVSTDTVRRYRYPDARHGDPFPEPDGYLGRTPWWTRQTVLRWQQARPGVRKQEQS